MPTPPILACGHPAYVTPPTAPFPGITVIGHNPATGGTLCSACAAALPSQPMTVYAFSLSGMLADVLTIEDTDQIPAPPDLKPHVRYIVGRDGVPLAVTGWFRDGIVQQVYVHVDVYGLHVIDKLITS